MSEIPIDESTLRKLKKSYNDAVKNKLTTFKFEGNLLHTPYAKYMIEHMENTLNNPEK